MNRRQLLSLPLLAAAPLIPSSVKPVVVGRDGQILDPGTFPKEGLADLQLHLDWLHTDPDMTLQTDHPIQYLGDIPEAAEPEPSTPGEKAVVIHPGMWVGLNLTPIEHELWREQLRMARLDADYTIITNLRVELHDPALRGRVVSVPGATDDQLRAVRDQVDHYIVSEVLV